MATSSPRRETGMKRSLTTLSNFLVKVIWTTASSIYKSLFAWWLNKRLSNRSDKEFAASLEFPMGSLFAQHNATLIENDIEDTKEKRYFDLAYATVSSPDFQLRFRRVRGQFDIHVRPTGPRRAWYELDSVLIALDGKNGLHAPSMAYAVIGPWDGAELLEKHWVRLAAAMANERATT